ncbi:MAG TPA: hypothetical protein ENJ50_02370 [Planctomycetaceae bacterium]|nr:hypothetical protein [Planctomycetaceae bacterium]
MNDHPRKSPIDWILWGVLLWGIGLAGAMAVVWNDDRRWWRALIVLACVGLFVGLWRWALKTSRTPE